MSPGPKSMAELLATLPQCGELTWIGLRPARGADMQQPSEVNASTEAGLVGDRYSGRNGNRHVTIVQQEHLPVIASLLGLPLVVPAQLRRNLAVKGINLLALKKRQFRIGEVLLECTGLCHPCSQMEARFGDGGYNAVRGHGGITARIIQGGIIRLGDQVSVVPADAEVHPQPAPTN